MTPQEGQKLREAWEAKWRAHREKLVREGILPPEAIEKLERGNAK